MLIDLNTKVPEVARIYVDSETGVAYIRMGYAMCPRYTPDGKVMVMPPEELASVTAAAEKHSADRRKKTYYYL